MRKRYGELSLLCAVLALISSPPSSFWTRSARWMRRWASRFWRTLTRPEPAPDYAAISRLLHPAPVAATPTRRAVRPARDQRPWIERFSLPQNTFAF